MTKAAARSAEARRIRRELDKELSAAAASSGSPLVWTAQDRVVLDLISAAVDRKVDLADVYAEAADAKARVKMSAEIRLLEAHVARLIKQVRTDVPQPETMTTIKARRAAQARWERERGA
jgi:hypothetical protein